MSIAPSLALLVVLLNRVRLDLELLRMADLIVICLLLHEL